MHRRRVDLWAAGALSLVLCAAMALDASSTPRQAFITVDYTLRWFSPAGMCVWLLLGWSLVELLVPAELRSGARAPRQAAVAALALVAAVAAVVALRADMRSDPYGPMRAIEHRVVGQVGGPGATSVQGTSFDALAFKSGLVYVLRRSGVAVVAPGATRVLGGAYERPGYRRVLRVDVGAPGAVPGPAPTGRTLARIGYTVPSPTGPSRRVVAVRLLPARPSG